MGTSTVFHIEELDVEYAKAFNKAAPWVFDADGEGGEHMQECFATEEAACARQREHRSKHGLDPMTGDPVVRS